MTFVRRQYQDVILHRTQAPRSDTQGVDRQATQEERSLQVNSSCNPQHDRSKIPFKGGRPALRVPEHVNN